MAVNTVGMYMMVAVEQSRMEEMLCYIECRFRIHVMDAPQSFVMKILIVSVDVMIEIACLTFMKDWFLCKIFRLMVLRSSAGHMVHVCRGNFMGST